MSLKILFVIDGLGPGGSERSLVETLPSLKAAGIASIVVFFHRHEENLEGILGAQGADVRHISESGIIRRVSALRRIIRVERPDIVHTALFVSDVLGRFASIRQKTVVVSSLVGTPYDAVRVQNLGINRFKLRAVRWIDGWTARYLTDHFHAVSESAKRAAVDALGLSPERITVVGRGRHRRFSEPSAELRAATRRQLGLDDADEVILNVGRQVFEKGQQCLVEAMQIVARRRPRARLLIAGARGPQSGVLEQLGRRAALNGRVQILGHRDDIPGLLACADLFVFPSLCEGAAGALLEAMASGLPIVASRIPAIEEAVEEGRNAMLVERSSAAELSDAITALLEHRDRATAFGRRSREIFEERFTLERSAAQMVEFYRRLAPTPDAGLPSTSRSELSCP
jgi:glycosyltransferase involved in cell wall biosynthesis